MSWLHERLFFHALVCSKEASSEFGCVCISSHKLRGPTERELEDGGRTYCIFKAGHEPRDYLREEENKTAEQEVIIDCFRFLSIQLPSAGHTCGSHACLCGSRLNTKREY